MHPSQLDDFEWDDENIGHLRDHGIADWEVVEVRRNSPIWGRNKKGRSGDWVMYGYTVGGRALAIVLVVLTRKRKLRAFTGRSVTATDRTKYLSQWRDRG